MKELTNNYSSTSSTPDLDEMLRLVREAKSKPILTRIMCGPSFFSVMLAHFKTLGQGDAPFLFGVPMSVGDAMGRTAFFFDQHDHLMKIMVLKEEAVVSHVGE